MEEAKREIRDLSLLDEIARDPDTTQANMAVRLGVAVGTVNWHVKRLIAKGYVKVKRAQRRKLRYIITPEGLALRARLTVRYVEDSFRLYREVRRRARTMLKRARASGIVSIRIEGEGDIADVCRLTCMELGFAIVQDGREDNVATLVIRGADIELKHASLEAAN